MIRNMTTSDRRMKIAACLIVAVFSVIPALFMRYPSATVDELGHLTSAAFLAGHDWSEGLHCAGGYYFKYGTAFFYYLPMKLFVQPVIRYRACLVISALFLSATGPIAYSVAREFFRVKDCAAALLIALISACPAAVLYQSNFARADWALVVTAWILLYALLKASEAEDRRSRILYTVLASAMAAFAYMCHTRGIVTLIALFLTVVLARLLFKIRAVHAPAYVITTAGMLAADRLLTKFFSNAIWGTYGKSHAAMDAINFSDYRKLLTFSGIKVFAKTVIGWIFSIASSTYGVVLLGFVLALAILIQALRHRKAIPYSGPEILTAFTGSLLLIGNILLGSVFFFRKLYKTLEGGGKDRADRVLYERYMICAVGILCLLALCFLIRENAVSLRVKTVSVVLQCICVAVCWKWILPIFNNKSTNKKMMVSVTGFYYFVKKHSTALLLAGIAGVVIFLIWLMIMHFKWYRTALFLMLCAYLLTFSWTWYKNRYKYSEKVAREMNPAVEKVMELYELHDTYPLIFDSKGGHRVQVYQPVFRDFSVVNKKYDGYQEIPDMLIIAPSSYQNPEGFSEVYTFDDLTYDPSSSKDTVYVKGDRLKETLEQMGQSLTPLE